MQKHCRSVYVGCLLNFHDFHLSVNAAAVRLNLIDDRIRSYTKTQTKYQYHFCHLFILKLMKIGLSYQKKRGISFSEKLIEDFNCVFFAHLLCAEKKVLSILSFFL